MSYFNPFDQAAPDDGNPSEAARFVMAANEWQMVCARGFFIQMAMYGLSEERVLELGPIFEPPGGFVFTFGGAPNPHEEYDGPKEVTMDPDPFKDLKALFDQSNSPDDLLGYIEALGD